MPRGAQSAPRPGMRTCPPWEWPESTSWTGGRASLGKSAGEWVRSTVGREGAGIWGAGELIVGASQDDGAEVLPGLVQQGHPVGCEAGLPQLQARAGPVLPVPHDRKPPQPRRGEGGEELLHRRVGPAAGDHIAGEDHQIRSRLAELVAEGGEVLVGLPEVDVGEVQDADRLGEADNGEGVVAAGEPAMLGLEAGEDAGPGLGVMAAARSGLDRRTAGEEGSLARGPAHVSQERQPPDHGQLARWQSVRTPRVVLRPSR